MTPGGEQQARHAADKFRKDHRLGVQPLGDLVELIEQTTGYEVAVLEADEGEHGLTMSDPARGAVFIGLARSRKPMRQRSTLAHELGHLIFGDWTEESEYGRRSPEEIRADAFARHLLVPIEGVRELLGDRCPVSEADLSVVVQRFRVSPQVAAIAMREARYITEATKEDWMKVWTPQIATRHGWTDHYAALQDDSNRLRAPQGLVARAVAGYAEGIVTAQTIATLRGAAVGEVLDELDRAGIVPSQREPVDVDIGALPEVDTDLSGLENEHGSS